MRFAGAGGHHQNGVAERKIRTVMNVARALMFHAAIHWPEMADAKLWPMAVQHAVYLVNHMPDEETGLSPHDLFTRTRWEYSKFQDTHVWGCPVYGLKAPLASGNKIPRWETRSDRLINMGHSPEHASTVPLLLNPSSGAMKTIFHVVFDDWYATVSSNPADFPDFQSPEWREMFGESEFQYPLEDEVTNLPAHKPPVRESERELRVRKAMEATNPPIPLEGATPLPTQRSVAPVEVSHLREPSHLPQEQQREGGTILVDREVSQVRELPSEGAKEGDLWLKKWKRWMMMICMICLP